MVHESRYGDKKGLIMGDKISADGIRTFGWAP
jgi:hypothetical protein